MEGPKKKCPLAHFVSARNGNNMKQQRLSCAFCALISVFRAKDKNDKFPGVILNPSYSNFLFTIAPCRMSRRKCFSIEIFRVRIPFKSESRASQRKENTKRLKKTKKRQRPSSSCLLPFLHQKRPCRSIIVHTPKHIHQDGIGDVGKDERRPSGSPCTSLHVQGALGESVDRKHLDVHPTRNARDPSEFKTIHLRCSI